jgi:hypothetical protein
MAISHFHYLVTVFGLTIWTKSPATVLVLTWFLQSFMFLCNIAVPDPVDYFFWQTITCCLGALAGISFIIVTRCPEMLSVIPVVHVHSWTRFLIWLVVFVPVQLFFGLFPIPGTPGGLLGTWAGHVIITCVVWLMVRSQDVTGGDQTFRDYAGRRYMFLLWLLSLSVMEMLFFLNYAFTEERWTSVIAGVSGIMVILLVGYVAPLKIAWRDPPAPLVVSQNDNNEDVEL